MRKTHGGDHTGEGKIVCVGAGRHGLVVADISNPQAEGRQPVQNRATGHSRRTVYQDGLVLANGNEDNPDENGLIIVDARNPQP
jgi:hypothetical protein